MSHRLDHYFCSCSAFSLFTPLTHSSVAYSLVKVIVLFTFHCSLVCVTTRLSVRFPATLSEGSHPFPSRTRKLSPLEPIILPPQGGGNVGRRRDKFKSLAL